MICLDNDVFSRYRSNRSYPAVSNYLSAHSTENWLVPSIVLFEYLKYFSSHSKIQKKRQSAEQSIDGVIPVDGDVAAEAANIEARLDAAGTSLAVPDLLVAACARDRGCTLATRNRRDFDKTPIHQLMSVDIVQ